MGFASTYLKNRALFPEFVQEAPDSDTGIIVVVPAYNEPEICSLLDSLLLCKIPVCAVEVLIVINAPGDAGNKILENNKITIDKINSWKNENSHSFFRLFVIMPESTLPDWGVGLARKTGMDEAVCRFNKINNPDGVILSLDADCLVEPNYFITVCSELVLSKKNTACSIYFEHSLSGDAFPLNIYESILQYELHLRYYLQGLIFSGYPYAFHTVGS